MRHWAIVLSLLVIKGHACTDFLLRDQKKGCVVGRSLEFGIDLQSEIVVSPRGENRVSMINGKRGMNWQQKYAYIGLSALGEDNLIIDGLNEAGLSFGILWLPDAKYPKNTTDDMTHTISIIDVGAWILGSFATIDEVKKGFQEIHVFIESIKALGGVPPVHLSFHDRKGSSLVIEFTDGRVEIYDNPLGVLTNAPKFDWQITNLRNYINLSPKNAPPITLDGVTLTQTGQGSGMLGLPGDWTPPSRFVKIAILKATIAKAPSAEKNTNLAFHLLNSVDIPYGAIQPAKGEKPDYTQWIVVKDLQSGTLFYRTYDNLNIRSINLSEALKKGPGRMPL